MDIKELLRPHLIDIKPYSSARDEYTGKEGIFLDANENPFGSATHEAFNRYPDPLQKELKANIAINKEIDETKIFLGNGSDEPIDLLIRAFCEPGVDNIIITPPTYGMYEVSAEINNVDVKKVALDAEFQLRSKEILKAADKHSKIVFLCSPNNPTGNCMKDEDIEEILTSFRGIVVIDEAYIDFSRRKSFISRLNDFPNLVVLQTFSKAWGMAALRLGMAFASLELVYFLNKIKPPYNVNGATQMLAMEGLKNIDWKEQKVNVILDLKEKLIKKLNKIDDVIKVYPSDANFILVKMKNAQSTFMGLIEQKIITRDRSKVTLCEGCIRITIGTKEENDQLIEALKSMN